MDILSGKIISSMGEREWLDTEISRRCDSEIGEVKTALRRLMKIGIVEKSRITSEKKVFYAYKLDQDWQPAAIRAQCA
jgi:predicted transcriptional regulator